MIGKQRHRRGKTRGYVYSLNTGEQARRTSGTRRVSNTWALTYLPNTHFQRVRSIEAISDLGKVEAEGRPQMQNTRLVGRVGIAATGDCREGARNDAVDRSQTVEHRAIPRDGKVALGDGDVGGWRGVTERRRRQVGHLGLGKVERRLGGRDD